MPHIEFKKMLMSNMLLFLFSIHIFFQIFFIFNSHGIVYYNTVLRKETRITWVALCSFPKEAGTFCA